jgi:hypothetical protein
MDLLPRLTVTEVVDKTHIRPLHIKILMRLFCQLVLFGLSLTAFVLMCINYAEINFDDFTKIMIMICSGICCIAVIVLYRLNSQIRRYYKYYTLFKFADKRLTYFHEIKKLKDRKTRIKHIVNDLKYLHIRSLRHVESVWITNNYIV